MKKINRVKRATQAEVYRVKTQTMIKIVEYKSGDQPHFDRLNREWIEKYFWVEPMDHYVLTKPEEAILNKGGSILFALFDNVVAGVVALIRVNDDTFEFAKMGVDENFRRRGIAEALSHAALEKAKQLNGKKIVLFSHTSLNGAIQLYRKLGFIEVPLDSSEYKRSNIKMELSLDPAVKKDVGM